MTFSLGCVSNFRFYVILVHSYTGIFLLAAESQMMLVTYLLILYLLTERRLRPAAESRMTIVCVVVCQTDVPELFVLDSAAATFSASSSAVPNGRSPREHDLTIDLRIYVSRCD